MIEIYLNGEKVKVTEAPTFEEMPETDFKHTFTVKFDKRNSDFKFYLAEVMRRSEQLKEEETMSFKDWKKRYKYKKSVAKKMYRQDGIYYSKKQLSQKYNEYLQNL